MAILFQFFNTNQIVLTFIYPLIFFLMGFGIFLKNHVHSRFHMAKSLQYLALFGVLHGIADWGDIFIPMQKMYLNNSAIFILKSFQQFITALSFFFLFFFGTHLLQQSRNFSKKILFLPFLFFFIWLGCFLFLNPVLVHDPNQKWWFALSDTYAGFLLEFPGGLLSGYAMFIQRKQFKEFDVPAMTQALVLASVFTVIYTFADGFIVSQVPAHSDFLLDSTYFFRTTGIPIDFFKALSGVFMAFFIMKILKVFDIEYQMFFSQVEKSKAVAEERDRIARDLHDGMIQSIYAIGLHLEGVRHMLLMERENSIPNTSNALQEVTKKLNGLIGEIRMYIKELKMPVKKEPSFKEEIERLVREMNFGKETEIQLQYDYSGEEPPLTVTIQIFYIIKEALSNALRHAKATKIFVSITGNENLLTAEIKDNGIGMEEKCAFLRKKDSIPFKHGLRNMETRSQIIGGSLKIRSEKNKGSKVILQVRSTKNLRGAENDRAN
jgi:signal transduction histidine kinase